MGKPLFEKRWFPHTPSPKTLSSKKIKIVAFPKNFIQTRFSILQNYYLRKLVL